VTGPTRYDDFYEEPDQLRDQLRQLLRYRVFIVLGVVLGLLGGAAVDTLGGDSYTSTGEVVVQPISTTPFDSAAATPDKQLSMGTEKQIAQSATVAQLAAKRLHTREAVRTLQHDLRVSNPPDTQTLKFEYTAGTPERAAKLVNAFVLAYLDYRERNTKERISVTVGKLNGELKPLVQNRKNLDKKIANEADGPSKDTDEAERGAVVTHISDLQGRISSLTSLDTTPGEIVRKGEPPAYPSGPGLVMLLLIGAVVGLAAGILAAWVRSVLEPRVRSVADVQNNLRAPVLGILPRHHGQGLLVVGRARNSNLAEAYRTIAFRLAHDQRFAGRSSLLVVAPRESGDAAAVAVNLAGAFAEIGNEVLLVEADLRAPQLGVQLPVVNGVTPPEASSVWPEGQRLTVDAGEAGQFGLVPGRRVPNVARALSSPQLTRMLATPADPNESVVVLTRPLLTHADGLAVAKRVDGVLVVCDLQQVRRDDLDRVWELITGAGGRILGAVMDKGSGRGRLRRMLDGGPSQRKFRRMGGERRGGQARYADTDEDYLSDGSDEISAARAGSRDNGLMTFRG
jgi:polysaccharide biosynthesis transport protein